VCVLNLGIQHEMRMRPSGCTIGSALLLPDGNRPLGRPRRRLVDNIRIISRRWDVGMWTALGWPRIDTGGGRL